MRHYQPADSDFRSSEFGRFETVIFSNPLPDRESQRSPTHHWLHCLSKFDPVGAFRAAWEGFLPGKGTSMETPLR